MSGEISNTRQFCEFEWFEWVMFQDKMALYPDPHFRLGRHICPSIDIGPAIMAKIIKENIRSFVDPCTEHLPKKNGNEKSAKPNVVCS